MAEAEVTVWAHDVSGKSVLSFEFPQDKPSEEVFGDPLPTPTLGPEYPRRISGHTREIALKKWGSVCTLGETELPHLPGALQRLLGRDPGVKRALMLESSLPFYH